jgi:putative flippase GtrA
MKLFVNIFNKIPKKFIIVGIINTFFGYIIGILNFFLFFNIFGIIFVGIFNNVISITFSFFMFKKFVFKTVNTNWISEYLRSYIVYGVKALFGILTLWLCIKIIGLNIYISQFFSMIITILLTYKGHKDFTFKVKKVE